MQWEWDRHPWFSIAQPTRFRFKHANWLRLYTKVWKAFTLVRILFIDWLGPSLGLVHFLTCWLFQLLKLLLGASLKVTAPCLIIILLLLGELPFSSWPSVCVLWSSIVNYLVYCNNAVSWWVFYVVGMHCQRVFCSWGIHTQWVRNETIDNAMITKTVKCHQIWNITYLTLPTVYHDACNL